jgi:two-component system phosphate regulon response regulator PhoB
MTKLAQILVVEDELEISRLIEMILLKKGYSVVTIHDGISALNLLKNKNFDLVLLDWMLPQLSGIDVICELRKNNNQIPVIFITAKTQPEDIVLGLESGADDYLTKPFESAILLARVESVLRRYHIHKKSTMTPSFNRLSYRSLSMNLDTHEVSLDNAPLHLTRSEFRILNELITNCEKVLTRDQLVEKTQGEGVNVTNRTIDTHVFGLRKKLGDKSDWIETIRGVGYRLMAE